MLVGCVATNNEVILKENDKVQTTKQHLEVAADMQKNVTTQDTLESTIASLSAQMLENKKFDSNKPVLITSFVRLDEFKKTTEFGRVVSESLINELSNKGFEIIEFRGQMAVSVNDEGEYFISRKPHELKSKIPDTYVVVGTYSRQPGKVMLNARVIDNITGKIITTAKRGPKPKFDDKFTGWYVKKEYLSSKQEQQCNIAKGCSWWYNLTEQKESLSKVCPGPNWSKGRLNSNI
jgi:TolB-like protein